jgi:hypothetical protein
MKMDRIRKRLAEIEKEHEQKTPIKFVTRFSSRADSTAYYLTNGTDKDDGVFHLHWAEKPPTSDAFKLRWLDQYRAEQIAEFRAEWEASPCDRDKAAHAELNRLLGNACNFVKGHQACDRIDSEQI